MHGVMRSYSGEGAVELFDRIVAARDEVEKLLRGVQGFQSYTVIRTPDGGTTITVCNDKAGTDESVQVAGNWVAENASDTGAAAPTVSDGPVEIHLT